MLSLGDVGTLTVSVVKIVLGILTGASRGVSEHKKLSIPYKNYVFYATVRSAMTNMDVSIIQAITSTTKGYNSFTKKKKIRQSSVQLENNTTGHWLGNEDAKNVLIWFHGGGYVNAASEGHYAFLWNLVLAAQKAGSDLSVLVLAYELAPQGKFPRQLQQANSALAYLLSDRRRDPKTIIIGGDSAGGHLALSLVSHLMHPHPSVTQQPMPSDFAGLLLLSPWVTFEQSSSSFQSNEHKDLLPKGTLKTWSDYFIGNSPIDNYSAALNAPASWWETMPFQKIAVVAGDDEVFRDDVVQMAKTFETVRPSTQVLVAQNEPHDAPVIDQIFKTAAGASTDFATKFVLDCCEKS